MISLARLTLLREWRRFMPAVLAVGFAGLLVVIMRSDEVRTILFDLVKSALTFTNPNDAPAQ